MNALQKFIDETFKMTTGLGDMKVAEAIFLDAVDFASKTMVEPNRNNDEMLLKKVVSLAYKGQNIIKMCVHLPRNSKAEKYAIALNLVAREIDNLLCSSGNNEAH